MPPDWSYAAFLKPSHPAAPSLALVAGAAVPPSIRPDSLFTTSPVTLAVSLAVDSKELDGEELLSGALVRELVTWLDEHKASLGLDSVGRPSASPSGINIPLFAAMLSARSSALALPPNSATALAANTSGLDRINLSLTFRCASTSKAALKVSQPQLSPLEPTLPTISLTSQLLAPSPQPLHFTLSPLVAQGLTKLATKLSAMFPLCFNPRWIDRLTNDLSAQRSLATSLISILGLSTSGDSRKTLHPDVAKEAARLQLTLSLHLSAQYPSRTPPTNSGAASSPPLSPSSLSPSPQASLEKALLLIAKHAISPDAWNPSSCVTSNAKSAKAKKGNGQKRGRTEEGAKGEGGVVGKAKRSKGARYTPYMRRKEQDREDDEALALMDCEVNGDELKVEVDGDGELSGLEGHEDFVARAEGEEGGDWEGKAKGECAALEQEGVEEVLALRFDEEDEEGKWGTEVGELFGDDDENEDDCERLLNHGWDDAGGMELLRM
ncbi:hypothetical protein JCM1841_006533 [Sporobolomyces salmonicolor]